MVECKYIITFIHVKLDDFDTFGKKYSLTNKIKVYYN